MENKWSVYLNPFQKIAGYTALLWGMAGLILSAVVSYYSGFRYNGLLHFGPAPDSAFWSRVAEHLVVWLIPAVLFYVGGLVLSKSKIRPADVFGTVAFAQIPLVFMSLLFLLGPLQRLKSLNPAEIMQFPELYSVMFLGLISLAFIVWMLIWMFQALKTSCNLKGVRLGVWYTVSIIGGDILCRIIIGMLH